MFEKLFNYPFEDFVKGSVGFGSQVPRELAVLAVAAAVFAAVYFYRRSPASVPRRRRMLLSALRGVTLGLLVLILFRPVLRSPMPMTKDCFVVVLADNSRSMRIEDAGAGGAQAAKSDRKSRLAVAKKLLGSAGEDKSAGRGAGEPGLIDRLTSECKVPVRLFRFSQQAQRISDLGDLDGTGDQTNLFSPLMVLENELRGVPVVGVVLLTDGSANTGGNPLELAREMRRKDRPVYCIGLGDPSPPRDYEVLRVQAPRVVRANTSVEVYANIRCVGFDRPFQVTLRRGQKVLQEVQITPAPKIRVHRVPLSFQPKDKGTFRYTVEIPPAPEEVILDNNRYEFLVKIADDRLPVLYLEGSPREEYRFLRRALFRDKEFRIASILRLVNERPDKIKKRDRNGPRPFVTQGAEPEDGLEDGYPKTKKHLFRFEAVIFGDIESDYLTKKQLEITEAFVRERGGGFLMLGGVNSFNLGDYQRTIIAKMLPVSLQRPDVRYQQVLFDIALTQIGLKHPIMRQTDNPYFNKSLWAKAPSLIGFNPVREQDVKPGAQVLAVEPKDKQPVLVVQKYGAGRSAAFTTGGSWHWQMALKKEDELHEKFWKQLVRWLALGTKAKLTIELNKDIFAVKEPVAIRSICLDHVLKPVNDAEVVATVEDPYGNKQELPQEWILSEEGVYQTQYTPIDVGDFKVEVEARLKDPAKTVLHAMASFSVGETLDEFNDVGQKVAVLQEIALASGGKYYKPEQVGEIVEKVKSRVKKVKRDETRYDKRDIWDTPLLFALLALSLSVEWFLRRRSGLM